MADDLRYVVTLDLRRVGDFGIDDATRRMPALDRSFDKLKSKIGDMGSGVQMIGRGFDAVVATVGRIAVHGAIIGTTAAVGALTYGVVGLNAEMQKTEVSLPVRLGQLSRLRPHVVPFRRRARGPLMNAATQCDHFLQRPMQKLDGDSLLSAEVAGGETCDIRLGVPSRFGYSPRMLRMRWLRRN